MLRITSIYQKLPFTLHFTFSKARRCSDVVTSTNRHSLPTKVREEAADDLAGTVYNWELEEVSSTLSSPALWVALDLTPPCFFTFLSKL